MAKLNKQPGRTTRNREVTAHLRRMASETHDMSPDGTLQSRAEAMAILLWDRALGYVERRIDDEGVESEIVHKPESWAITLIYDRLEGRTLVTTQENESRVTAATKVRELATARLNKIAETVSKPSKPSSPKKPPSL